MWSDAIGGFAGSAKAAETNIRAPTAAPANLAQTPREGSSRWREISLIPEGRAASLEQDNVFSTHDLIALHF
jgi:hypothetical protein